MDVTAVAVPVKLDYDDYLQYTEMHPDGDFELLNGVIYEVSPERDPHALTRNGIHLYLAKNLDSKKYTPWTETSFRAPGWKEGPKPDNSVSIGPLLVDGKYAKRPEAVDIALVIEISGSRPQDDTLERKLVTYARVKIPEYWLIDLVSGSVVVHRDPSGDCARPHFLAVETYGRHKTLSALTVEQLSFQTDFLLQLSLK